MAVRHISGRSAREFPDLALENAGICTFSSSNGCFLVLNSILIIGGEFNEMTARLQGSGALGGTKAELKIGDLLEPGHNSNYGQRKKANYVYLTATLDAAVWGAELAVGDAPGRIYRVEPTGIIEDDPNLTNTRFQGNPTRSYRTRQPQRVVGEVLDWEGHSPAELQRMRDYPDELKRRGIEAVNE